MFKCCLNQNRFFIEIYVYELHNFEFFPSLKGGKGQYHDIFYVLLKLIKISEEHNKLPLLTTKNNLNYN